MVPTLELSPHESALLLELLERERADLHCEIRHSRFADVRDMLREKRGIVEHLMDRIRQEFPEPTDSSLEAM